MTDLAPFAPARRANPVPVAPTDCGNYGETLLYGYNRHLRHGETPCDRCKAASAQYKRELRHGGPLELPENRPTIAEELAAGLLPGIAPGLVDHLALRNMMTTGPDTVDALDVLRELTRRPAWMRDALCREYPGLTWHPGRGEPTKPQKDVCARCAVQAECLAYVQSNDVSTVGSGWDEVGIWGGTSARERRQLRSKSVNPAA